MMVSLDHYGTHVVHLTRRLRFLSHWTRSPGTIVSLLTIPVHFLAKKTNYGKLLGETAKEIYLFMESISWCYKLALCASIKHSLKLLTRKSCMLVNL